MPRVIAQACDISAWKVEAGEATIACHKTNKQTNKTKRKKKQNQTNKRQNQHSGKK